MADRRMFAKTIIDSDAFLDMPLTAQALYFHLSMRADDDGFVNNPKRIQRSIGCNDDDYNVLVAKRFILTFESGIIVIKHWKLHNYIRQDRKKDTAYPEEMALLEIKDNGAYSFRNDLLEITDSAPKKLSLRQKAYEQSNLPYSFDNKIRMAFYGKPCPVCGVAMRGMVDECGVAIETCRPSIQHNIPISKGGKHELGNISVICHKCNVSLKDTETGALNADEVIEVWDSLTNGGQLTGKRQTTDRIGKDSIGKDNNSMSDTSDDTHSTIVDIIAYLNHVVGAKYTTRCKSTNKMINARLREGHTVDDFKTVIDKKYAQWGKDPKMAQYLRPETLFCASHFESYLNEIAVKPNQSFTNERKYDYAELEKELIGGRNGKRNNTN